MATALPTPPPTSAPASRNGRAGDVELVEYDRFIEKQIRKTRATVKLVDLAYAMLQLTIGVILVLLAATLVEQWLVTGGFSTTVRYLVFGAIVVSGGYFFVRRLWPLLWGRINPVYAAHTIEQGHPTLKNSLVNFLLFRTRREQMPVAVYDALEQQAAQGLSRVHVDLTVDRTPLIRLGYVLVAIVVVGALYAFFSPKHPFATAGRVLAPWASIAPPSRVDIDRVEPGTATATQGETLTVSAEIRGLREGETVRLRYTTADGKEVDAATTMRRSESGLRYEATLPPVTSQSLGLDDDLQYRIEAGDARTVDYKVKVLTAPAILVRQVDYEFPDYTGYVDQQVNNLGDIRGIEGTRVTIHAEANGPIRSAEIDFNADGRSDLRMKSDGNKATVSFVLALREDRHTPQHTSYTLKFQNSEGRTNPRPVQYKIDVVPDYSPEVDLIAPDEKVRDVRLDETVLVSVEARDPDFALNGVTLTGQSTGKAAFEAELLKKWSHEGRFTGDFKFTPSEHNLRAGDEVQYWATARDTRQPEANVATSSRQTFRIVAANPQQPNPNDVAQNDPQRNQDQQPGKGEKQEQPGQAGEGEKQEGKEAGEGVSRDAERSEQPGEKGEQGEKNDGGGEGEKQAGAEGEKGTESGSAEAGEQSEQPQDGEQQEGGEQREGGQPGETGKQSSGRGQEGGEAGEQTSGEGQPSGEEQGQSSKGEGGQPGGGEQSPVANDGTDDGSAFERINQHLNKEGQGGQQGERREGGEQTGEPTENAADEPQTGEKKPGEGVSRDAQRSADQPQDNQPGTSPAGQSQPNEKEGDTTRADDGQRGGEEQPQGKPGDQKPDASEGTGAKTQQGSPDSTEPQAGQEGETKSAGGEEQRPRGEAGQGAQEKPMGAPDAEQPMQERQKTPGDPNEKPPGNDQEPAMPSQSKKESDSRGEQGGDRSGGGEEGGGQKSPREGTGSAGQKQAADEGAGQSADQGPGDNSNQAGSDAASQEPTGNPGEQSGEGSGEREGAGDQPGGKPGEQPQSGESPGGEDVSRDAESRRPGTEQGKPGEQPPPGENKPGQQPGQSGGATGNPTTGGTTGSEANALPSNREAAPGDEANLEFARKQTELTLEKLSDQLRRKEVDQEMLDKLGWSEADLKRFVDRWQQRIDATKRADEKGKNAKQELDQALKSLGIRPRELSGTSTTEKDTVRDLRDGPRGPTPLEWQEWLRAYNQGVSRGANNRGDR